MRRPNILLCYTDQQRWDAVGVNGNPDISTPTLDKLAADGVNFDHCFVQNPVCMPSRVSMLTGQYPATLGITHMGVPVPEETVTLPRMLRNYGYVSGNIGKLHFLPHANRDHREPHPDYGFDHLEISDEPGCYPDAYYAWVARTAPDQADQISVGLPPAAETWRKTLRLTETITHPAERFPKRALPSRCRGDLTHSAFVAEQTMEFIRTHRDRPWLAIAGFYSPHSPWVAPQEFLDRYDPATFTLPTLPPVPDVSPSDPDAVSRDGTFDEDELRAARHGYYAMVSEVDHHVGRLLDGLEELDLTDDTVVVFISDHGEWLGEHRRYGKSYPAPDCVSRVPLLMRWPGRIARPGRTISTLVEAVDVVPTLLEACGIPLPPRLQGASLFPLLDGRAAAVKDSVLMESAGWKGFRTELYHYLSEAGGRESLFDLDQDPNEYTNVADDPAYADTLASLRAQLLERLIAAERPLPRTWPY